MEQLVQKLLQEQTGSYGYRYCTTSSLMKQYGSIYCETVLLPENETLVYTERIANPLDSDTFLYASPVKVLKGKGFPLKKGEAVINQSAYQSLFGEAELPVQLMVPMTEADGSTILVPLEIVGLIADADQVPFQRQENGDITGAARVYTPGSSLPASVKLTGKQSVFFYSHEPEATAALCKQYGTLLDNPLVLHDVCSAQNSARELLKVQAQSKFMVTLLLFLILSINLYGCFSNALNSRRFEIGVKRALGAPAKSIVLQFLMEALVVAISNILISVVLVTDLLIIYKAYQFFSFGEIWSVYISPHSLGQFLSCSLGLTVLFSLIFAWKATQVQIVDYLKSE